jgi:hypothetical protein
LGNAAQLFMLCVEGFHLITTRDTFCLRMRWLRVAMKGLSRCTQVRNVCDAPETPGMERRLSLMANDERSSSSSRVGMRGIPSATLTDLTQHDSVTSGSTK